MTLGELEKEAFRSKITNKSDDDLRWMMEILDIELRKRNFDEMLEKKFRICDNCNSTWPESVNYCRCGKDQIMRTEYVVRIGGRDRVKY